MVASARIRGRHTYRLTAGAAVSSGEVRQLPNGQAAAFTGLDAAASGDRVEFTTEGQYTIAKTAGEVWLDGDPLWWDHSAEKATCLEPIGSSDRDFFLGSAIGDAASADVSGAVNLNEKPAWIIDTTRDNGDTVLVLTAGAPTLFDRGGMMRAAFDTTAEAQKVDWLSDRGFAVDSRWIVDILMEFETAANNVAADFDVGVASGTHATDFESIAEFAAFHFDGDDTNIDAHSDDGTTDIAPTDTTIDWTAGTPIRLKIDGRDITNVKYYVEGDEVLSGTANLGNLSAAAGPLHAIFHQEKTANATPGVMKIRVRVRTMEQDSLGN